MLARKKRPRSLLCIFPGKRGPPPAADSRPNRHVMPLSSMCCPGWPKHAKLVYNATQPHQLHWKLKHTEHSTMSDSKAQKKRNWNSVLHYQLSLEHCQLTSMKLGKRRTQYFLRSAESFSWEAEKERQRMRKKVQEQNAEKGEVWREVYSAAISRELFALIAVHSKEKRNQSCKVAVIAKTFTQNEENDFLTSACVPSERSIAKASRSSTM